MEFTWSETKRASNIKAHRLDFMDALSVFDGMTYTFEDDRFTYNEQRFVTLGLLAGITVSQANVALPLCLTPGGGNDAVISWGVLSRTHGE